jgi:gliding motility-associated-like protein
MRELLLTVCLALFGVFSVQAQCPPPNFPEAGDDCAGAPILCETLDGYCSTINNNNVPQSFPGCPGFALNNDEWFAFFAGSTTITIEVVPSNCSSGSNPGLQAGIYQGCGGPVMDTQCECETNPFILSANNFIIGEVYWVVLDGCAGDVCDYEINVLQGSTESLPPADPGPISGPDLVCEGSTEAYSLAAVNAATIYNWTITPAIGSTASTTNNADIAWFAPGTAEVCVTVSNLCEDNPNNSCFTVEVQPTPTATLTASGALCAFGDDTGVEVSVNFTGPSPWTFEYTLGGANQPPITTTDNPYVFNVTTPGNVVLQSIDGNGCPGTVTGSVNVQETVINGLPTGIDPLCNGDATGQIFMGVNGGQQPLSFNWDPLGSGQFPNGLPAGTYNVTITDAFGCEGYSSITLDEPPPLEATITGASPADCANPLGGSITTSVTGGSPIYGYLWVPLGAGANPTNLPAGPFFLTVIDSNGCTDTTSVTVPGDFDAPNAEGISTGLVTCVDTVVTLDGTGSDVGANISYLWTGPGTIIDETTLMPTVNQPGTYELTVTNSDNGCTDVAPVTVGGDVTPPTAIAVAPPLTCADSIITIDGTASSAGPEFSYQWTGPAIESGDNTLTPQVSQPGTYTLVITNADNGCTNQTTVDVTEQVAVPTAVAMGDSLGCNVPTLQINGNGSSTGPNFTYLWTTTDGNIVSGETTLDLTVDEVGSYELTVTDITNGCTATAIAEVVEDADLPVVDILPPGDVTCDTPQFALDATGSNTGPEFTYQWTTPDGNIVSGDTTLTPVIDQAGQYILTVTNNFNGCSNDDDVIVLGDILEPSIAIAPPATVTCAQPIVGLDATGSDSGVDFQYGWTTPDGQIDSGADTPTPQVSSGGTYILTLTNTFTNCVATDTILVPQDTDDPLVALDPADELNCTVLDVQLQANVNGGTNFAYTWTTVNGNIVSGADTPQPVVDAPGQYEVEVVNTDNGCSTVTSLNVDQNIIQPVADAGTDELLTCAVPQLALDGSASDGGPEFVYQWTTPDGNIVAGATTVAPDIDAPGTYVLAITNTNNNCVSLDTALVTEDVVAPIATILPSIPVDCANPIVTLDGTNSSTGTDFVYQWTTLDGNIVSGETTTMPDVDAPGTYTLTVTNTFNGCTTDAQLLVDEDIVLPGVDAGPGGELNCTQQTLQLQGALSGATNNFVFAWTTPDGSFASGETTLFPVVELSGTYTLTVTDTVNQCVNSSDVIITQDVALPFADVVATGPLNCDFPELTLDATASSQGTGLLYDWTTPDGNYVSGTDGLTPIVDEGGTYILTINDTTNACVTADTLIVFNDTLSPVVGIIPPAVLTCDLPLTFLDGSAAGGANLDLSWTTPDGNILSGATTLQAEIDAGGTYTFTVTNLDNGCVTAEDVLVSVDQDDPVVDAGPTAIINCQDTQLNLAGTADGGGAPLVYQWTTPDGNILNGADGLSPEVDAGGTYLLEVENTQNGCTSSDDVIIDEDVTLPTVQVVPNGLINCFAPQIALDGAGTSTGAEFTYLWTTPTGNIVSGADALDPQIDASGVYTLTVSNTQNFCVDSAQVLVDEDFDLPTADAGPTDEINCVVAEIVLAGAGSQGAEFAYTWTTPDGSLISGANTLSPTVDAEGTYVLEILDQDNGCSAVDSVTITSSIVFPVVNINTPDTLDCLLPNQQLDAAGSDAGPGFSIQWTTPDGNILSGGTSLQPSINGGGTYTLTIVNTDNLCETFADVFVPIDTIAPIANAGPGSTLTCLVTDVTLDGTNSSQGGPLVYSWTTPDGNILSGEDGLSPLVDAPGIYTLLITNQENGCTANDAVSIAQDTVSPVAAVANADLLTCAVTSINLNGGASSTGPAFAYNWSTLDGNILNGVTTLDPEVDAPGTYDLLVTDQTNGCTDQISVIVDQDVVPPVIEAGQTTELNCDVTTLDLSGSATGNNPNLGIVWSTNDGNIVSGGASLMPVVDAPGTYELTVTDLFNGCISTDDVIITQDIVLPTVVINDPDVLNCIDDVITVSGTGSSSGPIFELTWTTPDGNILGSTTGENVDVDQPGSYQLTILNTDNGCSDLASVNVLEDIELPIVDAGADLPLPCTDPEFELDGTVSASTSNLDILWTTNDGVIVNGATTLTPQVNAGGVYVLTVTNLVNGCSAEDQIEITTNLPVDPQIELTQPPCATDVGVLTVLDVTDGTPPYLYSIDGGETFQADPLFTNLPEGIYTVVVQDVLGCETVPEDQFIDVPDPVVVDLEFEVELLQGDSYQVLLNTNQDLGAIDSIQWIPERYLSCTDCLTPVIEPLESTTYELIIQTANGCVGSDFLRVIVDERLAVYAPNIFSPNDDGNNDRFFLFARTNNVQEIRSFQIFDRWGEVVHSVTGAQPNDPTAGWDGTFRGQRLNAGVYVWYAEIEMLDGQVKLLKGDVTLAR